MYDRIGYIRSWKLARHSVSTSFEPCVHNKLCSVARRVEVQNTMLGSDEFDIFTALAQPAVTLEVAEPPGAVVTSV